MIHPATGDHTVIGSRDKQIMCGLFLSKFDRAALEYLGFESFAEAFNLLAYSLGAKPASIKNYRDELDPYFPNKRQGWHGRPLRDHCRNIMDKYADFSMAELGDQVRAFLSPDEELQDEPIVRDVLRKHGQEQESSFAKRLITGKAAEGYFVANYRSMSEFADTTLIDTTHWGCGFDFKMTVAGGEYAAVEVKGLRSRTGSILLTDLERAMAEALSERYYLAIVRNFAEQPFHTVFRNPLTCGLDFARVERTEVRVTWVASAIP